MNSKFGKNSYPILSNSRSGFQSGPDRQHLVFIASIGLAFSLVVIFVVLFNFKQPANARSNIVAERPVEDLPSAIGTVTLLTPARYVSAGTPLSDVQFKEVYWPRNQVPSSSVRDLAQLQGAYAKVNLEAGMPLQLKHLTKEKLGVTLPLTPGNRAIAIEIDATSGIEGHARPGTRVDVVLTYMVEGKLTSKILVQNARVLSYGGDTTMAHEVDNRRRNKLGRTITLDVSPQDALKIETAKQLGKLNLIMRAADDNRTATVTEISTNDIDGAVGARQKPQRETCSKGRIRFEGREYVLDCNDSLHLVDSFEP